MKVEVVISSWRIADEHGYPPGEEAYIEELMGLPSVDVVEVEKATVEEAAEALYKKHKFYPVVESIGPKEN